jgi:flagellar basal-body rod protein FlgG
LLEGMYSAAAGMAAQQQRIDSLANDMANVNTTGYKRVRVAFHDLLYTPTGPGAVQGVASGAGAAATQVGRGEAQGTLQQTGRTLDVGLEGTGYLEVRNAAGKQLLTRDGALHRTDTGRLFTTTGAFTGVTIPAGVSDDQVRINRDGVVAGPTGTVFGRLRLVSVRAPQALQSQGDNLFAPTAASGRPTAALPANLKVQQGVLEASNVDMATVMTDLIDAQRGYELASKAITNQDRLLEIANGVKR